MGLKPNFFDVNSYTCKMQYLKFRSIIFYDDFFYEVYV